MDTLLEKDPAAIFNERINEGMEYAKKLRRRSSDAAEELLEDTTHAIKHHPIQTVLGAFGVGLLLGGIVGFVIRKK